MSQGAVGARVGPQAIDGIGVFRAPVDGVDQVAVGGDELGAGHSLAAVLPADTSPQVAGQQGLAGLGPVPTEEDLLAFRGAGAGDAVVAAPVRRGVGVPGRVAGVAGPAAQPQADALVPEGPPGVVAQRHGLARRPPVHGRKTVPLDLVPSLGHRGRRQQLADHQSLGVEDLQRKVAVLGHGDGDRLEALKLLGLHQSGPVDARHAAGHLHAKLAGVGQADAPRLEPPLAFQDGRAPAVRRHEGEDAVRRDARLENVLDRKAAFGADGEIGLDGHAETTAGPQRPAVAREQPPGNGYFLGITLAVGIDEEGLPRAFALGVLQHAFLEIPAPLDEDHVLLVAVAPAGEMIAALLGRAGRGDRAELQAVAGKPIRSAHLPGVVQRRLVDPAGQHVKVLRVVHRVDPHGELLALVLHVAAGEDAAGKIPVVDLAVDRHLSRRGQHGNAQVLGFRRHARACPSRHEETDRKQNRETSTPGITVHGQPAVKVESQPSSYLGRT